MAAPAVATFTPEPISAPIDGVGRGDAPRGGRGRGRGGGPGAGSGSRAGAGAPIPEGPGVFRVKSETSAKSLSGAISAQARSGVTDMSVNAIGPESVNQGMKAIIIARGNVSEDGFDFIVRPDTVMEVGPDAICVKVTRLAAKQAPAAPDASNQLRVTGMTKPTAIAGAIAGKAREGALVLSVTAIGPAAVLKATKGLAIARSYVKDDGLDIYAAPRFVDIKLPDSEEGTRTGVNLDLFVERK